MLCVLKVNNRHESENIIKIHFKKEFAQRKDYGTEYFQGDVFEMVILIKTILETNIIEITIDFQI
jgi:c-di-GMP-related signal transduction protein